VVLEVGCAKYADPSTTCELTETGGEYKNVRVKHSARLWGNVFC